MGRDGECRTPDAERRTQNAERTVAVRAGLLFVLLAFAGCSSSPPSSPPPTQAPPAASVPDATTSTPQRAGEAGDTAAGRWDVDLRRDERRGGHTIERHVGRSDDQLRARLRRESIAAASTYADIESAERVVATALAENARRIQSWIDRRSPKTNLAIRYRARDGLPTGRLMKRGRDASMPVTGAVVVLRWRGGDWYVLTTYPEDAR